MSKIKLENYDDYDFDADFARDYDQEYDDYEAFKQVQPEEADIEVEEPEVDAVIDKPKKKKSYSASYEKMREEINKEVEEYGDDTYTPFGFGDDNTSLIGTIINVFLWAAAAVAIVLFIYFIITREIVTAFLYVIGLIVAFFFGYGIMYFLDKFIIEK